MEKMINSNGNGYEMLGVKAPVFTATWCICWTLLAGAAAGANAAEPFSYGQITWENRQIDVHPEIQDTNAVAVFKFTNVGRQPLTIGKVKTDCSCTTASETNKIYAPGESGAIEVRYKIGNRVGLQQANVVVESDDPAQPVSQLTLRVFVPELIRISPSVVEWKIGYPPGSKKVTIHVVLNEPIHIIGVNSSNDQIFGTLHTITAGREYTLTITPDNMREQAKATFFLESDYPKSKPRIFYVYAVIK